MFGSLHQFIPLHNLYLQNDCNLNQQTLQSQNFKHNKNQTNIKQRQRLVSQYIPYTPTDKTTLLNIYKQNQHKKHKIVNKKPIKQRIPVPSRSLDWSNRNGVKQKLKHHHQLLRSVFRMEQIEKKSQKTYYEEALQRLQNKYGTTKIKRHISFPTSHQLQPKAKELIGTNEILNKKQSSLTNQKKILMQKNYLWAKKHSMNTQSYGKQKERNYTTIMMGLAHRKQKFKMFNKIQTLL